MDETKLLEEKLREAACVGDTDAVQGLINLGVDVNTQHSINGWTPLHWACKRNYQDVVVLLLKSGANKDILSKKGESPASVSTNPYILQLLGVPSKAIKSDHPLDEERYGFVPNYLKNAPLMGKVDVGSTITKQYTHQVENEFVKQDLVLKIRIANSHDQDFIEVDLSRDQLSYSNLVKLCCDELGISTNQIERLRKLPNTKLRRDKDVHRLENFQEIEVQLNPPNANAGQTSAHIPNGCAVSITPTNNYQSISKKDQTVLY
ncbi:hypothetical protein QAD02_014660 [Eretmocerus hayati]|uniref:Uncharacterized protein n=1 Tax=Eretmocerus hayati TaxID=131215 RepID=A0ACC2P713_9HYME|nr:hypothetical protein QAD02_014660 [Eretmocerus hayati]